MLVTNLSIHVKLEKFEKWCNLQQKGKGVILYKEFPPANRWLRNREGLTLSEWIDALKMVGYVAVVQAVPGRSWDNNRCRRCLNEIETLPHILGFCPYGEALRNIRHHTIRSMLAEALKEVQGLGTEGSVSYQKQFGLYS